MMEVRYENGTRDAVAGMYRGTGSLSPIRRRRKADSFRSAFAHRAPRTRVQKEGGHESQSKRTQAEGQTFDLGPRFPRHDLVDRFDVGGLPRQFRIGQAFSDDALEGDCGTLAISVTELRAVIISEVKFSKVAFQM